MTRMIFAAAMALMLSIGVLPVMAQRPERPQKGHRPTMEERAHHRTDKMAGELQLNEQQSKEVYAAVLASMQKQDELQAAMREARRNEMNRMKEILTPEQFEQWQKMMERAREQGGPKGAPMHGKPMHRPQQAPAK